MPKTKNSINSRTINITFLDLNSAEYSNYFKSLKNLDWLVDQEINFTSIYSALFSNFNQTFFKPEEITSAFIREVVEKGLDKSAYLMLRDIIDSPSVELNRVIRISARTIQRRERFHPDESERILRVASAFQHALSLFEDLNKARNWFHTAKKALNNNSPFDYCDTDIGATEVKDLLGRLDYGIA